MRDIWVTEFSNMKGDGNQLDWCLVEETKAGESLETYICIGKREMRNGRRVYNDWVLEIKKEVFDRLIRMYEKEC